MVHFVLIRRLCSRTRDYDAKHLEAVRAAIAHGKDVLEDSVAADAFAGRKTQEPFPHENKLKQ
jgi:hypothetical protein